MLRRRRLTSVLGALALCALALAVPAATAAAATFTVDSLKDQKDAGINGTCQTEGGECTLRAAIEESNASAAPREIKFSSAFNGQAADTISLGSPLPPIEVPMAIEGGDCFGEDGPHRPCTGVDGPSGGPALTVEEAANVTIKGLAVTGAQVGIDVINGSLAFTAQNDWVGVPLPGGSSGGNGTGIFIGPGSDKAVIGGAGPVSVNTPESNEFRDVVSGNTEIGLDLEGASEAAIQGNYFGVMPDGSTLAANEKDIEITDFTGTPASEAKEDEVGHTLEGLAPLTPQCDGACNVIAGATEAGVDLEGDVTDPEEAPASGPTFIRGNNVGLGAGGVEAVPNGTDGVFAGGAADAVIGGAPFAQGNRIVGGEYGVRGTGGGDLQVFGNEIGLDGRGTPLQPPSIAGILVDSQGLSNPLAAAEIKFNIVQASGGEGIDQRFTGARIVGNAVTGGTVGIRTLGATGAAGNSIQGNLVEGSTRGVVVENDHNVVASNEVFRSGDAGVEIVDNGAAAGNVVGGDTITSENIVSEGHGGAIEIVGPSSGGSENEIARNNGSGNSGLFLDLGGDGPGNPGLNGGVQPPVLSTATRSGAAGIAQPGARVRVFRKAAAEPGEIESFLGEAVADGAGHWSVTYPSTVPVGGIVAATQTNPLGGTSELATAVTAAAAAPSPPVSAPPACLAGGPGCGPVPTAPRRPDTKITKRPPKRSARHTASFRFRSSQRGSTFRCKLDHGTFRPCSPPKKYRHLKAGRHVFQVRAVGRSGLVDRTPAVSRFRVLPHRHRSAHRPR